jgi:hypothetical protein
LQRRNAGRLVANGETSLDQSRLFKRRRRMSQHAPQLNAQRRSAMIDFLGLLLISLAWSSVTTACRTQVPNTNSFVKARMALTANDAPIFCMMSYVSRVFSPFLTIEERI